MQWTSRRKKKRFDLMLRLQWEFGRLNPQSYDPKGVHRKNSLRLRSSKNSLVICQCCWFGVTIHAQELWINVLCKKEWCSNTDLVASCGFMAKSKENAMALWHGKCHSNLAAHCFTAHQKLFMRNCGPLQFQAWPTRFGSGLITKQNYTIPVHVSWRN
jgi:hypothetical protein